MKVLHRQFDPSQAYGELLKMANTSDTAIRRLIRKADEENVSLRDRVLHLPATLGDLYGHKVVFDAAISLPRISGFVRTTVELE